MTDFVVIAVLVVVVALIVRGMRRGTVGVCEGDCGSCGHACSSPRIRLTPEQKARLAEIDKRSGAQK